MILYAFLALFPATPDLSTMLKAVESRYNNAKTLQVTFQETLSGSGRRRTESGELFLRKPGRMRWEYSDPAGKLFLSDGKNIYYYNASSNRAEKMKLKESDDMRAPLAFLLGRLDFDKDFRDFESSPHAAGTLISVKPKSEKLPYRQVDFVVDSSSAIRELIVHGHDNSILTFNFANEKVNPAVSDKLFKFELPAGATFVDTSADGGAK